MLKVKIHSMVDVITNSSTVIYTYQDSVKEAKELVQEVLSLSGIPDMTPDDVFYYGVFCDDDIYCDCVSDHISDNDEWACSECDKEYDEQKSFCSKCGSKVVNNAEVDVFIEQHRKIWTISFAHDSDEGKAQRQAEDEWMNDLKLSIVKGEADKPEWMTKAEEDEYGYNGASTTLYLLPKEERFNGLGEKISKLLGSVGAEEGSE